MLMRERKKEAERDEMYFRIRFSFDICEDIAYSRGLRLLAHQNFSAYLLIYLTLK